MNSSQANSKLVRSSYSTTDHGTGREDLVSKMHPQDKKLCTDEQLDHADKLVVLEDSIVVIA